ncbi:MAG TPA: GTPase Era [Vicinamibacterales bacterium]|jgi:GTP-binding protein Era|nr:GTPase Era [Vicinamibacterales bacterium]
MKSGFVSFLGRPNAGKSTLLNRLVGQKLAIVSDKPQTTRTRILGVKNYEDGQVVFIDTPGVHKPMHRMNVRMVDTALEAVREVDVLAVVVDASVKPGAGDEFLLNAIKGVKSPVILVLNKVDLIAKPRLLPMIDRYQKAYPFVEIVPVSATDGTNVEVLERLFLQYLPEGDPIYPADYLTDQPERFFAAEIVREQVLQLTHDELPFSTAVIVDRFEEPGEDTVMRLFCTILVDRESQKPIVVGKAGAMIKKIGTAARAELERFFGTRMYLDLHVKVKSEWRDDARVLDDIGLRGR